MGPPKENVEVNGRKWPCGSWSPTFDRYKISEGCKTNGSQCATRLTVDILKEEAVPFNKWAVYDENGRYYVEMKVFGQTLFLPTSLVQSDEIRTSLSYRWEPENDEVSGRSVPYTMASYLRNFWPEKKVWVDYINHLGDGQLTRRVVQNMARFYDSKEVIAMYLDYRCTEPEKLVEFILRGWMWQELAFSNLNKEYVTAESFFVFALRIRGMRYNDLAGRLGFQGVRFFLLSGQVEGTKSYFISCLRQPRHQELISVVSYIESDLLLLEDRDMLVTSATTNLLCAKLGDESDALAASFAVISQKYCENDDLEQASCELILGHPNALKEIFVWISEADEDGRVYFTIEDGGNSHRLPRIVQDIYLSAWKSPENDYRQHALKLINHDSDNWYIRGIKTFTVDIRRFRQKEILNSRADLRGEAAVETLRELLQPGESCPSPKGHCPSALSNVSSGTPRLSTQSTDSHCFLHPQERWRRLTAGPSLGEVTARTKRLLRQLLETSRLQACQRPSTARCRGP